MPPALPLRPELASFHRGACCRRLVSPAEPSGLLSADWLHRPVADREIHPLRPVSDSFDIACSGIRVLRASPAVFSLLHTERGLQIRSKPSSSVTMEN